MAADSAAPGQAGQRALYHAIADAGSLRTFGEEIGVGNPSGWPGYEEQLRRARDATGARHAVTTGVATVAAEPCVLVGFEFSFLGGSMGAAEGARIARAFSVAAAEGLPIVCIAASGDRWCPARGHPPCRRGRRPDHGRRVVVPDRGC